MRPLLGLAASFQIVFDSNSSTLYISYIFSLYLHWPLIVASLVDLRLIKKTKKIKKDNTLAYEKERTCQDFQKNLLEWFEWRILKTDRPEIETLASSSKHNKQPPFNTHPQTRSGLGLVFLKGMSFLWKPLLGILSECWAGKKLIRYPFKDLF